MTTFGDNDESPVPWATLTLKEVFRLQGEIVDELRGRRVIRTRNLLGELAETIVATAYSGTLGAPSQAAWDVLARDRKLQVKARVVEHGERRTQQFTPFNTDEADPPTEFVFIAFDSRTYEILWAREVTRNDVISISKPVPRSTRRRVNIRQVLACPTGVDVTREVTRAYASLDTPRPTTVDLDPTTHHRPERKSELTGADLVTGAGLTGQTN